METFDGYKSLVSTQVNKSMTFAFSPQGGQLVVNSSLQYASETATTTEGNANSIMVDPLSVIAASDCNAYKGGIAGGIIGACLLGLIAGVFFSGRFWRPRRPATRKPQGDEIGAPLEIHENLNNQREAVLPDK